MTPLDRLSGEREVDQCSGQQLLSYYLMSSYLYYALDQSVLKDTTYDYLCARLLREFDSFEHPHKHLVTKEDLNAGTGYRLTEAVAPPRLKAAALHWLDTSTT